MLIKNIFVENGTEAVDIRVADGKFEKIAANLAPNPGEEVVDCTGCLAIPPFIEPHVHLDTCLTAGDPVWNMSGTLFEGISSPSRTSRTAPAARCRCRRPTASSSCAPTST